MLNNFNLELSNSIYEPFFYKICDQIVEIIDSTDQKFSSDLIYTFCYLLINIPIEKLIEKQIIPDKFEKLFLKCNDCLLKSEVKRKKFKLF